MNEPTKKRALNAFIAMGTIPDDYVTAAENTLYEAEAGIRRPVKPIGPVRRFLSSGWGAAVISGIVALTVLLLIIHAGQNPPTSNPFVPPMGSSIEISDEGVNFTIATEQEHYPDDMNRFTVIMRGKNKGEKISMRNAWYLERLTDEGAVAVEISYTEEVIETAQVGKDEYAVIKKIIYGTNTGGGFMPGTYRLHATKHNGEKYVSVAWCEFTVGAVGTDETDFTITARSPSYPKWTSNFSVILTSPTAERSLASVESWYLERLTAEGAERIGIPYVNTAVETAKDANSIIVRLTVPMTVLDSGLYRVHALGQDGDKLVSLASCTFTVEENEEVLNHFEFHPMDGTAPYTVTVPDIPYGSDSLTITVTATEPGVPLTDPPLHWFIGKLNSGHWPFDYDLDPWDASVTEIKEVLPSEETNGYAQLRVTLTFRYPPEWTPGPYYLYALTEPFREYNYLVSSCRFNVTAPPEEEDDTPGEFIIATDRDYYMVNTNRITVIMTGTTPGKSIADTYDWRLEWLTAKGAKEVQIYYTDQAGVSAKPAMHQYATISKTIHINDSKGYALQPGSYRLYATERNGKELVTVASCEFEVAEPEMQTEIADVVDRSSFRYDPYSVAVRFSVETDAQISFGTDTVTLSVTAEEPMISIFEQPLYWHIQRERGYEHTSTDDWQVTDTSPETYIRLDGKEDGTYAHFTTTLTLLDSDKWEPGTYRVYALTAPLGEENIFAASCVFTILEPGETVYESDR